MTTAKILAELQSLGRESYKKVMLNHGVEEPIFGVKIEELKKIVKREKPNHALALELYATGNYDAMYLAGLLADDSQMSQQDLQHWVENTKGTAIAGVIVPWVAAGSSHGWEMGLRWIDSDSPTIAGAGWATLASVLSVVPNDRLDIKKLRQLMKRVETTIHKTPDFPRYQMNFFLIACGGYVPELTSLAKETGQKIGKVTANLGNNACSIPSIVDYLTKMEHRGTIGKKKKTAKC